jgi:hypothetical protein
MHNETVEKKMRQDCLLAEIKKTKAVNISNE